YQTSVISIENTLFTASNNHFYRCYNYNDAFHITFTIDLSFFFRCPSCFYHQVLNNYTINCPICMVEFGIDSKASQLPCKHFFHNDCIVTWLINNNTCPLCRHNYHKKMNKKLKTICKVFWMVKLLIENFKIIILI
ncbi:hypothetical protein H5410_003589, partial [Solanum commersonii]